MNKMTLTLKLRLNATHKIKGEVAPAMKWMKELNPNQGPELHSGKEDVDYITAKFWNIGQLEIVELIIEFLKLPSSEIYKDIEGLLFGQEFEFRS